jgi:hypothetical protein
VNAMECPHEFEVVQVVLAGRLEYCDEVRMHAESCEVCREVVAVASLMRDDRNGALGEVQVPAAGQVWWRAAIRARLDATNAAARPMTWAHGVAGACAAGLTVGIITVAWPTIEGAWAWLGERVGTIDPAALVVTDLASAMLQRTVPFGLAAACLLLAPVALYLALSGD